MDLKGLEILIGIILSIIAARFAVIKYFDTKKEEFKREFWRKRYENYEKVLELASKITVSEDLDTVEEEIKEYRQYYWGKLAMIEDQKVYDAMKSFNKKLKYLEGEEGKKFTDFTDLQDRTYDLARACRLSLKETWEPEGINISDLKKKGEEGVNEYKL